MKLMLKEIRKARHITQEQMADALGIKLATYRTWEQGSVRITLENAYNVAVILNCTPNDLCGWSKEKSEKSSIYDIYEQELIECFRQSTKQRKANILQTARDAAGMSKYSAERDQSLPKSG